MVDKSKTIYENFLLQVNNRKNNDCIYYEGKTISYNKFNSLIDKVSAYFTSIGLKEDDLITLVAPNTPEAIACFFAASKLNINIHLLHPLSIQENILHEYKDKHSKLLITVSLFLNNYDKILKEKMPILVLDPTSSLNIVKRLGFSILNRDKLQTYKNRKDIPHFTYNIKGKKEYKTYDPKKGRIFLSSGGTTGISKSIVLSDFSFVSLISTVPYILGCTQEELTHKTMLAALPMFHGFGLTMGVLACILWGARIGVLPSFRTKKVIKLLKKGHLSMMIGVPAIYEALLKNRKFKGKMLKNIEVCFIGGDFISPSLLERFNQRLKENGSKGMLLEGYGLTETVTVLSVNTIKDHKEGTIGKPLPNVKVKIIDHETNKVLPNNTKGEIAITGETLMNGYYEEKEDPFITIDGEKYVKSGDMGMLDEDNYLYFISRYKRMLKKKGMNVYPLAIEKEVSSLDEVEECSLLGETYKGRDNICLFVSLSDPSYKNSVEQTIIRDLKGKFDSYELPDFIIIKDKFVHTNVGKIDYVILQKELHQYLENKNK